MRSPTQDDLPLECVYRWERERPHRIFLTQPSGGQVRDWTWAQAAGEARRIASYLKAQNWEPGSRIAILSKNCAWWMMADLAIWMAGHVSVPIYPSLKAQSVLKILEHSESRACFLGATDEREAMYSGLPPGVLCIRFPTAVGTAGASWDDLAAGYSPIAGNPRREADDLATILYTSGTTGTPKGVMHSFANFRFFTWSVKDWLGLTDAERILSYLPLAHVVERAGVEALSLFLGCHLFFSEGLETFRSDLARARPTLFQSVPRLLLKFQQGVFAKIPKEKLDRLLSIPVVSHVLKKRVLHELALDTARYAVCGAAPLPTDILLWYRNLGLELGEGYGMTEILITHLSRPGSVRPGYVGCAMPGIEAKAGPDGELLVRSPMNMLGYYKDPQGTRDAFTPDGFFRTGDVVEIDADGQMRIIGRLKEQFKTSKGKYVAPAPIESKLAAHPAVEACCLVGAGLPSPFAIVLLTQEARERCTLPEGQREIEQSLLGQMAAINAQLDPHERVAFLAFADGPWTIANGLITPTLKVKRAALEGRYQALIDKWKEQEHRVVWESAPYIVAQTGAGQTVN